MTEVRQDQPFSRIVVAFDASPQGHALLRLAAEVASCFESPLAGLFLEDEAALLYADLPIAEEVSLGSAAVAGLSSERMQAHSRAQARVARRALDSIAVQHKLSCSFLTHRGKMTAALSTHAETHDLVLVSSRIGAHGMRSSQDTLTELMQSAASGLMALFDARAELRPGPVAVVLGNEPMEAAPALAAARRIAERRTTGLTVFILGAAKTKDPILAALEGQGNVQITTMSDTKELLAALRAGEPSLIVLSDALGDPMREATAALGRPVLLVRRSS
jgi:hypothetical protein